MSAGDREQVDGNALTVLGCDAVVIEFGDSDRADASGRTFTGGAGDR